MILKLKLNYLLGFNEGGLSILGFTNLIFVSSFVDRSDKYCAIFVLVRASSSVPLKIHNINHTNLHHRPYRSDFVFETLAKSGKEA